MSPSSKLAHLLFLYHPKTQTEADHGMYKMCRFCCFCTTQRHRQRQTQTMECTKCVDFFAVFVPPKDRDRHRPWNVQMSTFLLFLYHDFCCFCTTQRHRQYNHGMYKCVHFLLFLYHDFCCFCTTQRQTDTDHGMYEMCRYRPHLCYACDAALKIVKVVHYNMMGHCRISRTTAITNNWDKSRAEMISVC